MADGDDRQATGVRVGRKLGDRHDTEDLNRVTTALRKNPIPLLIADHRIAGGPYATTQEVRGPYGASRGSEATNKSHHRVARSLGRSPVSYGRGGPFHRPRNSPPMFTIGWGARMFSPR